MPRAYSPGDIPDQYGRRFEQDDGAARPAADPGLSDLPPLLPGWGPPRGCHLSVVPDLAEGHGGR